MAGRDTSGHPPKPPDKPLTYASATKGRFSEEVKKYAEFVSKEKLARNLIEIKFVKNKKDDSSKIPRNVSLEVISEYVFVELGLKPEDILEIDLNTGRFDTKQILLKPEVDSEKLTSEFPNTFDDYVITINKLTKTNTKITFKNVPAYIPDLEILNLCALYGKVEGEIKRERISMKTSQGIVNLPTSTRSVMMNLDPGKTFNNFYWIDGPLQGDQGRRITVLHAGQPQQCSFCLKNIDTGCLGMGNGKRCEEVGGKRTRMSEYMNDFKAKTGYQSIKEKYMISLKMVSDKLESDMVTSPEDMDKYIAETDDLEIVDDQNPFQGFVSPIQQRDEKINELTEQIDKLKSEVPNLEEAKVNLEKESTELKKVNNDNTRKVNKAREVIEVQLLEMISKGETNNDLINLSTNVYTNLLKEEEFDLDESGTSTISQNFFLKDVDREGLKEEQKAVLDNIIKKIAFHFSSNMSKTARRLSLSVKRNHSEDEEKHQIKVCRSRRESEIVLSSKKS